MLISETMDPTHGTVALLLHRSCRARAPGSEPGTRSILRPAPRTGLPATVAGWPTASVLCKVLFPAKGTAAQDRAASRTRLAFPLAEGPAMESASRRS